MLELARTVRFCIPLPESAAAQVPGAVPGQSADPPQPANTFSAHPPMRGLGSYYELTVTCRGDADAATGYLMNIARIDEAVRAASLAQLTEAQRTGQGTGSLLRDILHTLRHRLGESTTAVTLALTPYHDLTLRSLDMDRLIISQQYEFSAAHRLHVPALSEAENRRLFGKCNNPAGHGHNYRLKVAVACPIDAHGRVAAVELLDAVVDRFVIQQLDHKHLNLDVPQFEHLNPSVENITREIWRMLDEPMNRIGELVEVSVWETGKTVCTYRGPTERSA